MIHVLAETNIFFDICNTKKEKLFCIYLFGTLFFDLGTKNKKAANHLPYEDSRRPLKTYNY